MSQKDLIKIKTVMTKVSELTNRKVIEESALTNVNKETNADKNNIRFCY